MRPLARHQTHSNKARCADGWGPQIGDVRRPRWLTHSASCAVQARWSRNDWADWSAGIAHMRSAHSTSIAQPIGALIKRGQDERAGGVTRAPHESNEIRYIDWASESNGFTLESVCVCCVEATTTTTPTNAAISGRHLRCWWWSPGSPAHRARAYRVICRHVIVL